MTDLFPLPRSLTGNGVRATFDALERMGVPLEVTEIATGTPVYDWTIPREWNMRGGWIDAPDGRRLVDVRDSTLHLVGYSVPVRARMSLDELRPHLFSDPAHPERIPYRTSYHDENWGFCLPHEVVERMAPGEYEVCVDTTLDDGSLTYAEAIVAGESDEEVLLSTYVCHPALANDNLSGIALASTLARALAGQRLRRTYRFLFSPATLGPLAWLSRNEASLDRIVGGLVLCCAGDPGSVTYKRSRRGNGLADRAAAVALRDRGAPYTLLEFSPLGGDERQFCSPGFDLPVGVLSRSPANAFDGYHSSADDLELVRPDALGDSYEAALDVIDVLERNDTYVSTNPKGEPQLGRRGLYRRVGGGSFTEAPLLWVLNLADGRHDLVDVAERSGVPFTAVAAAADALLAVGLLCAADAA